MPVRSNIKQLPVANVVYQYDGSYDGLMTCVFRSFQKKEIPATVQTEDTEQATLYPVEYISTSLEQSERVKRSIPIKISDYAESCVRKIFLSHLPEKEIVILRFLHVGFSVGRKLTELTTHEDVAPALKIVLQVGNEAHFSLEFLRFSEYGDFLAAEITPKNHILPLITYHFCDRFPDENFVIYDKAHKNAFIHKGTGETEYLYETEITFPPPDEIEQSYRRLWKHFYKTIEIDGRRNHKNRRTLMPMRYWPNMTEFQEVDSSYPKISSTVSDDNSLATIS
jgi:probable DNA metabolism protein